MYPPRRAIAVHPGGILQEILDQNQITHFLVAQRLSMAQSKISEICCGKRGETPDMAMRLGRLFGQSPLFWLTLQKNWELSQLDEAAYASIEPLRLASVAMQSFTSSTVQSTKSCQLFRKVGNFLFR